MSAVRYVMTRLACGGKRVPVEPEPRLVTEPAAKITSSAAPPPTATRTSRSALRLGAEASVKGPVGSRRFRTHLRARSVGSADVAAPRQQRHQPGDDRLSPSGGILAAASRSHPATAPTPARRRRDKVASVTQRVSQTLREGLKQMCRSVTHATIVLDECVDLPGPRVPQGRKPDCVRQLPGGTIEALRQALEAEGEHCLAERLLREGVGCRDITSKCTAPTEPWGAVRRSRYCLPVPSTLPEVVMKTFKIPKELAGTTLSCFGMDGNSLVFVQCSWTEGVMFSDRLRIVNRHVFEQSPEGGGLEWRQFVEVAWKEQLPWTLRFIKGTLESTCIQEAKRSTDDFAACLARAARPAV